MILKVLHLSSRCFVVTIVALCLLNCSSNTGDLEQWVAQIEAKPAGPTQNMPDIKEYQHHEYSSFNYRSPFAESQLEIEKELLRIREGCDNSIRPDLSRRKQDLERFSLDSMEMVGVIENQNKLWGLIQMTAGSDKGRVYHVTTDHYIGLNHGRIVDITEQQIEISTLIPDGDGCWERRTIYRALAQ
jgi:type IV pilus assembly protein PilP